MRIVADDVTHPAVIALLEHHLRSAHANSPAGSAFALDIAGLQAPEVTLFSAWDGTTLLGLGALKRLTPDSGELKSMRTAPDQLRKGVARAMLAYLTLEARRRGYAMLFLETGTNAAFAPARAMYEAAGFAVCAPFADDALTDFNRCYSKTL